MAVDVHAHITEIKNVEVLLRTKKVLPVASGYSHQENMKTVELAKNLDLPFSIGIAPQIAQHGFKQEWVNYIKAQNPNAIGEIGLDNHWARTEEHKKLQGECFEQMLDIAEKKNLPVVIHSRESMDEILEILIQRKFPNIVMFHFYSGEKKHAKLALKHLDAYFSIPPLHSKGRRDAILEAGLERVVVETDSPYIVRTFLEVEKSLVYVSEILGKRKEEVEMKTAENAAKIFKLSMEKVLAYKIF
ncbi:MAG: TatD family hydrolase [Candidatus Anstonellales archaeon]